jgi:hypothetical protein
VGLPLHRAITTEILDLLQAKRATGLPAARNLVTLEIENYVSNRAIGY